MSASGIIRDGAQSCDAAEVGGKAFSLFRLRAEGVLVPEFFVVPASASLSASDGRVPEPLRDEIRSAWESFGGSRYRWAVRSSAIAEDSLDDSYAGIYETVLGVEGFENVLQAIEHCWQSLTAERASAYRQVRATRRQDGMAVVVQRMVEARWSGVCFTADPTTHALSHVVVSVVEGEGERLVSGEANAEEFRFRRPSYDIVEHRLAGFDDRFPVELAEEVARRSVAIAESWGFPQDVEWSFDGEHLYFLQSRPITTIRGVFLNRAMEPWLGQGDPDDYGRIWSRAYADEVWTPPISPLFYDLQYLGGALTSYLRMHGDREPLPPDIFKYYKAAAYVDCEVLARTYWYLPRFMRSRGLVGMLPREMQQPTLQARWKWWGVLRRTWRFEVTEGRRWGLTRNHRHLEASWEGFCAACRELLGRDLPSLSEQELDAHVEAIWKVAATIGPDCGIAIFYHASEIKLLLTALLKRWLGSGDQLYAEVSQGLEGGHNVREAEAIWRFAKALEPLLLSRDLAGGSLDAFLNQPGPLADTKAELIEFLDHHRHRGASYKDVCYPRWGDDPELLWLQIRSLAGREVRSPEAANRQSAARREAAKREILSRLSGAGSWWKRSVLRRLFKYNEIYMALRDDHRFYYDHVWWMLRRAYLEYGRRLTGSGRLNAPEDVFFLVRREIEQLRSGALHPATVEARVSVRRQEWEATRRRMPARYLRRGYCEAEDHEPNASGDVIHGIGASSGCVTGRARVVLDMVELSLLEPGEILVTRQTDPAWTPFFSQLGGLVLETGSMLAHGASLCREFGVPCVTCVEGATSLIEDGELISIDGGAGILVRKIAGAQPQPTEGLPTV